MKRLLRRAYWQNVMAPSIVGFVLLSASIAAAQSGSLQVTIEPAEAVSDGAMWRLDDGGWMDSGTTASGMETTRAVLECAEIPGWTAPDDEKIWVFNGMSRQTTVTYIHMPSFPIGEIPSLQAFAGETLRFQVHSDLLPVPSVNFSAYALPPAPVGVMSQDLNATGRVFTYTPDPADIVPFEVVFTGSRPGWSGETQTITIFPIPNLPSEQRVFGLQRSLSVPENEDAPTGPSVVIETIDNPNPGEPFNTVDDRATLRKVTITGEEVVFDPSDPEGLHAQFHYNEYAGDPPPNIAEMVINAMRVVVKGSSANSAFHLPRTNLTINAQELIFEDEDPDEPEAITCYISTIPVRYRNRAADSKLGNWTETDWENKTGRKVGDDGAVGEKGGDIRLNIGFYSDNGGGRQALRFYTDGSPGQIGGYGQSGRSNNVDVNAAHKWYNVRGYQVPNFDVCTWYHQMEYFVLIPITTTHGSFDYRPGGGEDAYASGKPGYGGPAGNLHSTLDLSQYAQMEGGRMGYLTYSMQDFIGGSTSDPDPAYHLWIDTYAGFYVKLRKSEVYSASRGKGWHASQQDWYNDMRNGRRGASGNFVSEGNPLAFLSSAWIMEALNNARNDYLAGDIAGAENELSRYVEMLDLLEEQWGTDVDYTAEQMELVAIRDEMGSLLNRINSNLDYFGNPAGWVPMLSFEVNQWGFKDEIKHALNLMYLAHWVNNVGLGIEARIDGLEELWNDLGDEVVSLQATFNELQVRIPQLHTEAFNLTTKSALLKDELREIDERLRAQADRNIQDQILWKSIVAGTQLGLRVGGVIMQAIPVGQPALGAVGGVMDVAGKFDIENVFESVTGSIDGTADVATTFTDKLYKEKLEKVTKAVKGIDPKDTDIAERTKKLKDLSKATASMAQGVKGVTKVLGDFKMPKVDLDAEIAKLRAESEEYQDVCDKLQEVAEEKMELMRQIAVTTHEATIVPKLIALNLLAMDQIQTELDENREVFAPETMDYINEIDRRARERLLKYHYYMAKAYEYRLLKEFTGELNLMPLIEKIERMASKGDATPVLELQHFESLMTPYLDQLREIAMEIFNRYNDDFSIELGRETTVKLTPEQIAALNAGETVRLNLMEMGVFLPREENVRIVGIKVIEEEFNVHIDGDIGQTNHHHLTAIRPGAYFAPENGVVPDAT